MRPKPAKGRKQGVGSASVDEFGILDWGGGGGSTKRRGIGELEGRVDPRLRECFNKCREEYPPTNTLMLFLRLMCVEDCRREFLTGGGSSN